MWPFKRKKNSLASPIVNSVLCVPGYWKDSMEIIDKTNDQFMVVGGVMMDIPNKRHYTFQLCGRDGKMKDLFAVGGRITFAVRDFIHEIDRHTSVIYISCETGSLYNAWFLAAAGAALLDAGGVGVRVDSSGKAFSKERKKELFKNGLESSMYELFVVDSILEEDGTTFLCDMHNIGLRDSIISGLKFNDAQQVIRIFNFYQLIDKPIIKSNQTFQTHVNSPLFTINDEPNQPYKNEVLENSFGMCRLTKE